MKDLARCVVLAMFLVAIASPAWGQRARGNQRGGSNIENVVYLQGRVVIEDGAEPPDLVVVERVCMGQVFPEGFSEPNGRFSVRVGSNASGAMEDASTYGTDSRGRASGDTIRVGGITGDSERFSSMKNQGTVDLIGCDLQIRLDGFRTEAIPLARRNVFDNPDLGTIVLKRIAGLTGSTVSATSMTASKAAVKAFDKGRKELAKPGGDPAKAAKEFEKAVAAHGQHAGAWTLLGAARLRMGDEAGSLEAYRTAVEADPDYMPPYPPLVKHVVRSGDWQAAAGYCAKYVKLNPSAAEERFFLGLSHLQLGQTEESELALDQILASPEMTQAQPGALHLKGVILGKRGQFELAAERFGQFLEIAADAPQAVEVRKQLAEWKTLGIL